MRWNTRIVVRVGWIAIIGGAVALASYGCDDDGDGGAGGTTATGGGGGATGGMGGNGGAQGDSVTFIVLTPDDDGPPGEPAAGATVAFDAPDGTRTEEVTGADGKVTFDGIDWSLGSASATAHLTDYALTSRVNLDETWLGVMELVNDAVPIGLGNLVEDTVETATVSGTFSGLQDTGHRMTISATGIMGGSLWEGPGTGTFVLTVPTGEAFVIQGIEATQATILPSNQGLDWPIHQVAHQNHVAITDDVTGVVLDFGANAMTTHTASASFTLPTRADSPVRAGWPYTYICASNAYYCFGWPTHIDVSTDGNQVDMDFLWVEPTWAEGVGTMCRMNDHSSGQFLSINYVAGYPQGGDLGAIPDVPKWSSPATPTTPHPVHSPILWELFDADVPYMTMFMQRNTGTRPWNIDSGPNTTSLTIPTPPSSVDAADLLGTSFITTEMYVGEIDWDTYNWTRIARADPIRLQP
ncbi:MAG: hypothetical protein JRI68_20410 [Deltaproteobacteria bacterium]|nr:hypothetical protein [Deltaproteobacteria bacterium]